MSMAEPLMPHPKKDDTVYDERDAPVREEHGEPAEANDELTSAGRAAAEARSDDSEDSADSDG
jgi:hypothetical protein